MAEHPPTREVTAATFDSEVVERSRDLPVLVDFWAPWCGPCQGLMPVLEGLAEAYGGRFLLAKVNIDEQQELALRFGVRSVPTVQLFRNGEPVDGFTGAQPEGAIRELLERYIERPADRTLAEAQAAGAAGDADRALALLQQAVAEDPELPRARSALAGALLDAGRFDEAEAQLQGLPADVAAGPEFSALRARLGFARAAATAPPPQELEARIAADPKDSEARCQLAAHRATAGDYEGAMEGFLELLRRDRAYGDDAGRNGLLQVFTILGDDDERVAQYRRQLALALH